MISKLLLFFCGFLFSNILDTTIAEFQEWSLVGAAFIVSTIEMCSKFFYYLSVKFSGVRDEKYYIIMLLRLANYIKVGLIYGFIVDAFKLGS